MYLTCKTTHALQLRKRGPATIPKPNTSTPTLLDDLRIVPKEVQVRRAVRNNQFVVSLATVSSPIFPRWRRKFYRLPSRNLQSILSLRCITARLRSVQEVLRAFT